MHGEPADSAEQSCLKDDAGIGLHASRWHSPRRGTAADAGYAHILVCFLAFVLWKTLEMWQQRAGLGNSPRTLLEEFARIQSHDVILPLQTHGEVRLRCITQPDAAQTALLE